MALRLAILGASGAVGGMLAAQLLRDNLLEADDGTGFGNALFKKLAILRFLPSHLRPLQPLSAPNPPPGSSRSVARLPFRTSCSIWARGARS